MDSFAEKMPFDETTIWLNKNRIIVLKKTQFTITCLGGIVWVTGPNGFEHILGHGRSVSGATDGKVCILAFSDTRIRIVQKRKKGFGRRLVSRIVDKWSKNGHCASHVRFNGINDIIRPFVLYPP